MAMVASSTVVPYEEVRKQRVEENKRRMEELGLFDLSMSLKVVKNETLVRKPSRRKLPSQELGMEARRSSRVAGKPAVSYGEQLDYLAGMRMRFATKDMRQRGWQPVGRRYVCDSARMAAVEAAEEVYRGIKNPAFVKPMLHSHTASGFWLGLPASFCYEYLAHHDVKVMLEDEEQLEWECAYLANKVGLSGGWRGFSIDHELVDGDCCIFELVEPKRFMVYIFRCEKKYEGDDEVDRDGSGGDASDKDAVKDVATEKKKKSMAYNKKVSASAPAELAKRTKLSTSSARKLDLENEEEDEEGDDYSPKASKKVKREAATDVANATRSSKRRRVKEDFDDSKESAGVIVLDNEDESIVKEDARKPAAQSKGTQTGIRSFGRITRHSLARALQKKCELAI